MMMKRGGGALTEQSTRPLCPWLPLGTGFGVPPRWGPAARVHRAALQPAALQPVCTVHRTRVTTNLGLWERNAIYGRNANVWRLGRCA